jgi:hypothetical protein
LETVIAGFGPRGELPSPLPLPLPLSPPPPPLPFPLRGFPVRVPYVLAAPWPRASAPWRWLAPAASPEAPALVAPARPRSAAARPTPSPAALPRARRPSAPRPRAPPAARPPRPCPARPAPCPGVRVPRARPPHAPAPRAPAAVRLGGPLACPIVASCAPDARATIVAQRSTFNFIPFSILV